MKILLVEDDSFKIAKVVSIVKSISKNLTVDLAIDINGAKIHLTKKKYDLLIADLQLPQRTGDDPNPSGGANLINEIKRSDRFVSPNYIIGLTQYSELKSEFSRIWKVLDYSPSNTQWESDLVLLINHINKTKNDIQSEEEVIRETLILEGLTDLKIIKESIKIFNPSLLDKITIKSSKSAGAMWVANNIIIWAYSLHKKNGNKIIKAIGLLDGDDAGNKAKEEVYRVITNDSKKSNSFKLHKLKADYAKHLIPFYRNSLKLPITLEELFPLSIWQEIDKRGWLEPRNNTNMFLAPPKKWNAVEVSLLDHIKGLDIDNDLLVYLKKTKNENKHDVANYIINLPLEEKKTALANFQQIISDIETYLFK